MATEPGASDEKVRGTVEIANMTKPWRPPSWLDGWRATELPPVPQREIEAELDALRQVFIPADEAAIVVMLEPLRRLFGPLRSEQVTEYVDILSGMPEFCLYEAVERCRRECESYPFPKVIIEKADAFHAFRTAKTRLETALWRIEFEKKGVR
jgi:hypothetical protein